MTEIPPTRWERLVDGEASYGRRFEALIESGEDIDGEARLADVLAPRGARILDAGAGMGRVAAALAARGHDVTAVEKDAKLVAQCRRIYPAVPVVEADILELSPAMLEQHQRPPSYDVVTVVGNVMIYLAEGTESRALRTLCDLLTPEGRMLVGFRPAKGPEHSRDYPREEFRAHVDAAGLVVQHEFGTYELAPPRGDYVVAVLRRA